MILNEGLLIIIIILLILLVITQVIQTVTEYNKYKTEEEKGYNILKDNIEVIDLREYD